MSTPGSIGMDHLSVAEDFWIEELTGVHNVYIYIYMPIHIHIYIYIRTSTHTERVDFQDIRVFFGGPHNKDCNMLWSLLGSPYFGKL